MPSLFLTMLLLIFVSCAHQSQVHREKLSERIEQQEVRSIQQIKEDMQGVLAEHSELDPQTKSDISKTLDAGLDRLKELKDRESQVMQALLSKMLMAPTQNDPELAVFDAEIKKLYRSKAKNVTELIKGMRAATLKNRPTDSFYQDVGLIFREMR